MNGSFTATNSMFGFCQTSAENHTADTAKAIDTYFDTHFTVFLLNVLMKFSVDVIIIH